MDADSAWCDYFTKWPKEMPRRGVLVTNFGEQIPFDGFMTTARLLLIERKTPDTIGARKVIVPFAQIAAIKLVDQVRVPALKLAGFTGDLPNQH